MQFPNLFAYLSDSALKIKSFITENNPIPKLLSVVSNMTPQTIIDGTISSIYQPLNKLYNYIYPAKEGEITSPNIFEKIGKFMATAAIEGLYQYKLLSKNAILGPLLFIAISLVPKTAPF